MMGKARCVEGAPQRTLATFKSTGRSEEVRVIEKRVYRTDFPYSAPKEATFCTPPEE